MRTNLRVTAVLALGITSLIVACSSSDDTSSPTPDAPDSGSSGSSSGTSGSSGSSGTSGGPTDAATDSADAADANVAFKITSTAFTDGGSIPDANTCTGVNTSPPFAWEGAPPGTKSFALVLHDNDVSPPTGYNHSVIYDIASTTTSLPPNVEKAYQPAAPAGSRATHPFTANSGVYGYSGPCPPALHTYEFQLYALDVATLTDLGPASNANDGVTAVKAHVIAMTKLTGKYKKP